MTETIDARERLLRGAEQLFRKKGYAAAGLTEILQVSSAPKGSFYFYFRDGKRQLAQEVLARYGARVEAAIRALADRCAGDAVKFTRALFRSAAKEMKASGWSLGCLAQNFANELAPEDVEIAAQLAAVFAGWHAAIADGLGAGKTGRKAAMQQAMSVLTSLEGARTLARATRSSAPFDSACDYLLLSARE